MNQISVLASLLALLAACNCCSHQPYSHVSAESQKYPQSDVDTFLIENTDSLKRYAATQGDRKFLTNFEVDSTLRYMQVFKKLDSIPEIEQVLERPRENQKRTTDLKHYITRSDYVNDSTNAEFTTDIGDLTVCKLFSLLKKIY